jgi:hypothetical protein
MSAPHNIGHSERRYDVVVVKAAFQNTGTLFLAVLMLLFGAIYGRGGYALIGEWSAISRALAACAVLFVVCGAVMVACGLWLLIRIGRDSRPLWIGGAATALCGIVILAGVLSHVIPCAGPS